MIYSHFHRRWFKIILILLWAGELVAMRLPFGRYSPFIRQLMGSPFQTGPPGTFQRLIGGRVRSGHIISFSKKKGGSATLQSKEFLNFSHQQLSR